MGGRVPSHVAVAVCGGGPVGATFALLFDELTGGRKTALVLDARDLNEVRRDERLLAVSHGSRVVLERVGVWASGMGTPIHRIHVSRRGALGRCVIERDDYGLPALGYVINYSDLALRCDEALRTRGIAVARPKRVSAVHSDTAGARIKLDDGTECPCDYVVHAEGGLFAAQQPRTFHRDYQQSAVTAFVTCEREQPNVAWERFTDGGPLALLPARRAGRSGLGLVWCSPPDEAERRVLCEEALVLDQLHRSFGDRLGRFTSIAARQVHRLGLNAVDAVAHEREFAIGNAAQTLHPVAGQGLNLGLRDAFSLAQCVVEHFEGPATARRAFTDARRRDRFTTLNLTDVLARLFRPRLTPVSSMRAAALTFLDLVPTARHVLARHMMDGQR